MTSKKNSSKILIVSFQNFTGIAHLPKCLTDAGFKVAALCPERGHLSQTRFLNQVYVLPEHFFYWTIRSRFLEVVGLWEPDLLLPGDDVACSFLQNLLLQLPETGFERIPALIKHSMGAPGYYRSSSDKAIFGNMCETLGFPVPEQYLCQSTSDVMAQASRLAYPMVFKKTLSCGGLGVEICENEEELRRHATGFFGNGPMRITDKLRWEVHMARGADLRHLMRPQEESVVLQQYLPGRVLSHTFVSLEGEYLSGFTYENLNSRETSKHPCRKLRVLDVQYDCEELARKLSDHLKLTGFACLDFIRDESGELFLLECNARPTHTVILGKTVGLDLARQLFERRSLATGNVKEKTFSLFPDAMHENPAQFDADSSMIPWDDPALLISFVKGTRQPAISKKWLLRMVFKWVEDKWLGYLNRRLTFKDPKMLRVFDPESVVA